MRRASIKNNNNTALTNCIYCSSITETDLELTMLVICYQKRFRKSSMQAHMGDPPLRKG